MGMRRCVFRAKMNTNYFISKLLDSASFSILPHAAILPATESRS